MFNKKFLTQLKESADMEILCNYLGLQISPNGCIRCLWHADRNPSMHVYDHHLFCYSCGKRANAIDLVQKATRKSFVESVEFLKVLTKIDCENSKSSQMTISTSPKPNEESNIKTFDECLKNEFYKARILCLAHIYGHMSCYTDKQIDDQSISRKYQNWFKYRGLDSKFTLNAAHGNILLLDDEKKLSEYVKARVPEWKKSGLFQPNGDLYWFSESYCLASPVWTIFKHSDGQIRFAITSFRIRNIYPENGFPKEIEFGLHDSIKELGFPSSTGFIGINYTHSKYTKQIQDDGKDLNFVLTEGIPDWLTALHLFQDLPNTIVLTAGPPSNSAQTHTLSLIKNCNKLILAFDHDPAGEKGIKNVTEKARSIGIKCVENYGFPEEFKDLNDYLISLNNAGRTKR